MNIDVNEITINEPNEMLDKLTYMSEYNQSNTFIVKNRFKELINIDPNGEFTLTVDLFGSSTIFRTVQEYIQGFAKNVICDIYDDDDPKLKLLNSSRILVDNNLVLNIDLNDMIASIGNKVINIKSKDLLNVKKIFDRVKNAID
jgi:hypothetical protein